MILLLNIVDVLGATKGLLILIIKKRRIPVKEAAACGGLFV